MNFKTKLAAASLALLTSTSSFAVEKLIIVNEGNWGTDNSKLSYFENGNIVSNQWFRDANKNAKLGDTPNDIIQINDDLIAIALNSSNIIQFIDTSGKAVAATEDIPNNRKLASDGKYLYVSSYGHECKVGSTYKEFTKGYVAKIDISTYQTVAACEVGYEPEGIAYYNGHLFIANTGGYSYNEDHDYETTVSIVDAATMTKVKDIDTGKQNLYGKMSKTGKYLCINSAGDYYNVEPATVIFDCSAALESDNCFTVLDYASTYNCATTDNKFYVVGSAYSFISSGYNTNYLTIDPETVINSGGSDGVSESLPGSMQSDIESMTTPYGIYVNPYTGYIYATDSGSYVDGGKLYQWTPEGKYVGNWKVYINPGHFLALPPDGHFDGVIDIAADAPQEDGRIYNLQGIQVTNPIAGQIYIQNGKKFIQK